MTTARSVLVAMGALAAIFVVSAAPPANALPVDQYLKLRRQHNVDRKLAYGDIASNTAAHIGTVIELRGSVNGCIRRDAAVSFLLTLEDKRGILLDAPASDTRLVTEVNNQMLRVLARVIENKSTNTVPLEVLGVAYDGEVGLREKEAEQQEAAIETRKLANASNSPGPAQKKFASRGGYGKQDGAAFAGAGGQVSQLAASRLSAEGQALYPIYKAFVYKCNHRLTESELDQITVSVLYYSQRHRIDPRLVCALIIAESSFNPRSTSRSGAMGLGQLMPGTARDIGINSPYDIEQNVRACVNYFKMKLNTYDEGAPSGLLTRRQVQLALAAYNAGAGAVRKWGGIPPYRETQGYVKKILKLYDELSGQTGESS